MNNDDITYEARGGKVIKVFKDKEHVICDISEKEWGEFAIKSAQWLADRLNRKTRQKGETP
jgi:hypothetical protein